MCKSIFSSTVKCTKVSQFCTQRVDYPIKKFAFKSPQRFHYKLKSKIKQNHKQMYSEAIVLGQTNDSQLQMTTTGMGLPLVD